MIVARVVRVVRVVKDVKRYLVKVVRVVKDVKVRVVKVKNARVVRGSVIAIVIADIIKHKGRIIMKNTLFAFSSHHSMGMPNGRRDALSIFAGRTGFFFLRDRFGYLNQFSPYRVYKPCEKFPDSTCTKKLSDIMDERATEILSKSHIENKPLYLFVSGGVDSTAMTVAFLKAANGDYRNLTIVYTKYSEFENPDFFKLLSNIHGLTLKKVLPSRGLDDAQEEAMQKGYAVTGWCADQLFGSQINQDMPDMYFKDWRKYINIAEAIEQFDDAFNYYNMPISTFGEFAWFMNFSCKYDFVKYTDVMIYGKITGSMIPFYDTSDFNSWSVSNFDVLHKYPQHEPEHYKRELKEYIYAYDKNKNYLEGKGKNPSWRMCESSDGEYAQTYPVIAIAMETPTTVRVVKSGEFFVPSCNESVRRKDMSMKLELLRSYLKSEDE